MKCELSSISICIAVFLKPCFGVLGLELRALYVLTMYLFYHCDWVPVLGNDLAIL